MAPPPPTIIWNNTNNRFETEDKQAFLQYRLIPPSNSVLGQNIAGDTAESSPEKKEVVVMDMIHTYVPMSKRGMGVANHLCIAAFEHALNHSMLVIPTCSYISETFLPRNPSWRAVVFDQESPKSSI